MRDPGWARVLRVLAIVLMSVTALFTLMGGAGTSCVALDPTGYEGRFATIAPFQWLYVMFVIVTLGIGAIGVRAVVLLARGKRHAYRDSLVALGAGVIVGTAHMVASRLLRGGSMPVDMVVYTTIVTLIVFLLIRLPRIWQGLRLEESRLEDDHGEPAAAIALAACGVLALAIRFLMAPTHTIAGVNYADAWHSAMTVLGLGLILAAAGRQATSAARGDSLPLKAPAAAES